MTLSGFALRNRNPDVLECIANLSSDEVFTPPSLANQMLDSVAEAWSADNDGANIWADPNVKFLDPCTKSGVFLREIAKRLIQGLESKMPDLQERVEHVLTKQVFGIGITKLTSLMARRSLYCSKYASGEHSVVKSFDDDDGKIWFKSTEHTWKSGKCIFCKASEETYSRGDEKETHAYAFIHYNFNNLGLSIFGKQMQFDVVIGNPPYQLNDGGGVGSSAVPIYHEFVKQAIKVNPKFLSFIIPARWFSGGRGLDVFRRDMLNDKRIKILHDFPKASECFPGVEIKGGVCYFLWSASYDGECTVTRHDGDEINTCTRPLLEEGQEIFIRYNEAIPVLRKITGYKEPSFSESVSANDPFGFDVRQKGSMRRKKPDFNPYSSFEGSCEFYYNGWRKDGIGHISKSSIRRNKDWIDKYKVLIPKAWGVGNPAIDRLSPFIVEPNSCNTETYLVVGPFDCKEEAENAISYINTRFFHFLVSLIKNTQNTMQKAYSFVPQQDFSQEWTDAKLFEKYGLNLQEIKVIETMIWPDGDVDG